MHTGTSESASTERPAAEVGQTGHFPSQGPVRAEIFAFECSGQEAETQQPAASRRPDQRLRVSKGRAVKLGLANLARVDLWCLTLVQVSRKTANRCCSSESLLCACKAESGW